MSNLSASCLFDINYIEPALVTLKTILNTYIIIIEVIYFGTTTKEITLYTQSTNHVITNTNISVGIQ